MTNSEMIERDVSVLWHPCTQMKDHEQFPIIPIKKGEGVYIEDFDGNRYIDAISSWWVNVLGHTNPYINAKVKEQLDKLEHVIMAGFSHEQVVLLSERLVELTPSGLEKCFYADNGSSAVEVAMKMSYHYHKNRGENRPLFLSLENSYHGETLGALSVGDVALYKDTYEPLLIKSIQTKVPSNATKEAALEAADELEILLKERANEISAFIVEPIVQGAGYMHMYHPEYLSKARSLCSRYGVHLIADEIMTGFGRTGTLFACEQANISPDFMLLSKGLTGGYLPLSVVLTTNRVYSEFYADYELNKAFLHSHSYTGNALACAAANATLDIFQKDNIVEKNRALSVHMAKKLKRFEALSNVSSTRQRGMIAVVELRGYDPLQRTGRRVYDESLKRGVFIRPLGDVVYFMPPYVITKEQIDRVMDVAYDVIKNLP